MLAEAGLVVGAYVVPVSIAAATGDSGFDPTTLITYGITPTAMVLLFIFKWIVPGYLYKQTDDERKQLQQTLLDPTILQRNSAALEQIAKLIRTESHIRRDNLPDDGSG